VQNLYTFGVLSGCLYVTVFVMHSH